MRKLADAYRKIHPDFQVVLPPGMGSTGSVRAVLAGRLDIGLCGRKLKDAECTEGCMAFPYARTPFVFGVNRTVKRTNLQLAAIAAIYAGKQDRWQDGSRIRVVLRPPLDADIPIMESMSPEMKEAVKIALGREGMLMAQTDHDAADAIETVPGAIGCTTLAIIVSEKRTIRPLSLNGVAPSVRTLKDGSYPYSKLYQMVTRNNPPPAVRAFIDFVRSPAGASILAKNGQMPLP